MHKLEIYISTLMSNSIGFFFNTCMFLVFYFLFEPESQPMGYNIIYIIPLFINLFILSLGLSLILSSVYIIAKDIHQIWMVFVNLLFFISPIFYKLDVFRASLPGIDYVNPISGLIINARKVMLNNEPPEWDLYMFNFGYALFFLLFGLVLLNKLGSKAAEKL